MKTLKEMAKKEFLMVLLRQKNNQKPKKQPLKSCKKTFLQNNCFKTAKGLVD
jgi:hypothetical protein